MICKLLVVDPACAIRLSRRKILFSRLKFINMTSLNNDSRKIQKSDGSKQPHRENSQIFSSPPPPHLKVGGHRPLHFKNCSAGSVRKGKCHSNQTSLRDRPLKSNGGGGRRSTKKHARERKLNEKNPCTPISP